MGLVLWHVLQFNQIIWDDLYRILCCLEKLFELGIIQTLANMYKNGKQSEGNAFHEMIMNALVMFATVDTTRTIKVLKDNKVDFKDTLKTREETINAYGDSSPYLVSVVIVAAMKWLRYPPLCRKDGSTMIHSFS